MEKITLFVVASIFVAFAISRVVETVKAYRAEKRQAILARSVARASSYSDWLKNRPTTVVPRKEK